MIEFNSTVPLASNYLIHLVEDVERVTEILSEGYVPNFHKEDLSLSSEPSDICVYGIPMTSFADVDLENIKPLMGEYGNYGKYGIAMTKKWALNSKNISPVHYISDEIYLKEIISKIKDNQLSPDFVRYTKKYISEWKGTEYCNYIEREWRHALPYSTVEWIEGEENYRIWRTTTAHKRPRPTEALKNQVLTFGVEDVLKIIVAQPYDKEALMTKIIESDKFGGRPNNLSKEDCSYLESIITFTDILGQK